MIFLYSLSLPFTSQSYTLFAYIGELLVIFRVKPPLPCGPSYHLWPPEALLALLASGRVWSPSACLTRLPGELGCCRCYLPRPPELKVSKPALSRVIGCLEHHFWWPTWGGWNIVGSQFITNVLEISLCPRYRTRILDEELQIASYEPAPEIPGSFPGPSTHHADLIETRRNLSVTYPDKGPDGTDSEEEVDLILSRNQVPENTLQGITTCS